MRKHSTPVNWVSTTELLSVMGRQSHSIAGIFQSPDPLVTHVFHINIDSQSSLTLAMYVRFITEET